MTCKEMLDNVRLGWRQIRDLRAHLEELQTLATKITPVPSDGNGGGRAAGDNRKLENAVEKISEVYDQIADMAERQAEMEKTALYVISMLPNAKHRAILTNRFILRKPLQRCADDLGYDSYRGLCNALTVALREAEKIYEEIPKKF